MATRRRSVVWSFFEEQDDKKVLCLICTRIIHHGGKTTNMLRHLRSDHPGESPDRLITGLTVKNPNTNNAVNLTDGLVEAVMLEDSERAPLENGIEDMEVHGAIEGILRAAAGERPASDENNEMGDAEGITAATPSRKRSAVWVHYQKVDDERKAMCLLCKEKIQHQSSTSNLLRHLKKKHPFQFSQLETHSLKRTGGHKTCYSDSPQADLIVNSPTDTHRSNHTGTPSPPVNIPNHQLNTEQRLQSHNHSSDSCSGWSEARLLQRERELTEALRRVQCEEGRCLEQQRELLAKSRELQAETQALHKERHELEEEAKRQQKEKEEIKAEREKLHVERKEVERLKQELKEEQALLLAQRQRAELVSDGL